MSKIEKATEVARLVGAVLIATNAGMHLTQTIRRHVRQEANEVRTEDAGKDVSDAVAAGLAAMRPHPAGQVAENLRRTAAAANQEATNVLRQARDRSERKED